MSVGQADLTAARVRRIIAGTHADAPVDGETEPDFVLSPQSPAGPTTGFLLILKAPSSAPAVPTGEGDTFTITPWIRNPVTKVWGAGEATAMGYNQAFTTGDVDAAELYFQIGNVLEGGDIDFHVAEQ